MKFRDITILFLLFRAIDFLLAYLSPYFIPYLGFFPYKEIALQYNLPKFLTSLANFDGAHYLLIAKNGYAQYQQAFFPLYPLLIRWLSPLFLNNHLLTALTISNISFLLGLYVFSKYLKLISTDFNQFKPILTILFLLIFPTSFFFGAVYTEGLFFFLLAGCLYFLKKEKYELTAICAFLASLTRFVGVFLIIPILLSQISKVKSQIHILNLKSFNKFLITNNKYLISVFSPLLGLLFYSIYLLKTTGDPLFFLNSQWAFGANRTSSMTLLPQVYFRYLKIFFTASWNFQYFISVFEFIIFNFVFIIVILNLFQDLLSKNQAPNQVRHDRIGLSLFSLVNLLLPTLTGTFSSIPRYSLFSLSFFIYLSQIKNISIKLVVSIIFVIFHILVLAFFSQGYFIS